MESAGSGGGGESANTEAAAGAAAAMAGAHGQGMPDGIYHVTGLLVGHIAHMETMARPDLPEGYEDPPPGLNSVKRLGWIVKQETRFNPLTVFELYLGLIGAVWGFFLVQPYDSFDGTGKLWLPIRTMLGGGPGGAWYEHGAEMTVGGSMFLFHVMHIWAVCHGRRGDAMRGFTICVLLSIWASLCVLFFAADHTVPNYATCFVIVVFLCASLRAVFRKAGTR